MKAVAVFPGQRQVGLVDHPEPRLDALTQVKLRMLSVGVCGTDREICSFQYGTPPDGSDYLVIGHESLGRVIETGSKVRRLKKGDLVVPSVRRPCPAPDCRACRHGHQDFCTTGAFTERGIKQAHGFMTEWVVDDEHYLNKLPKGLEEVGVLVEPLTIAEKALIQVWGIQDRLPWGRKRGLHRAVVFGAGPVGLLGAMALVTAGFQTWIYSREPKVGVRADLAKAIGADYVSGQDESLDRLPAIVGNIDLVYEATGASAASFELLKHLGSNGIFVFTGVPGRKGPVSLDTDLIMRNLVLKNQVLFGTVNAGRPAFEAAISDLSVFAKRWPKIVRSLITGRHPVEDHRKVLLDPPSQGIKEVMAIG